MEPAAVISLVHPSRGRPDKALATLERWLAQADRPEALEHLLSLDSDDAELGRYLLRFGERPGSWITVHRNGHVVAATNRAAALARGDILLYLSDDFGCPPHWDSLLLEAFGHSARQADQPRLLKVDDGLQPFTRRVLTIPVMNRALYRRLGYFWHPGYRSMFVDQDLFEVCLKHDWLLLRADLRFPHEHPANGLAPSDETYRRSSAHWEQGKALFLQRMAQGFGA